MAFVSFEKQYTPEEQSHTPRTTFVFFPRLENNLPWEFRICWCAFT